MSLKDQNLVKGKQGLNGVPTDWFDAISLQQQDLVKGKQSMSGIPADRFDVPVDRVDIPQNVFANLVPRQGSPCLASKVFPKGFR